MVWEALQNLGIVATGTTIAGLIARYGIQRFSGLVEQGIERSSEAVEQGIERSAEVVEEGIDQFFETKIAHHQAEVDAHRLMASGLHEERASILIELYQRFVQFDRDMRALQMGASSDSSTEQLLQQVTESENDFSTYYEEHKIYFPPDSD